MISAVLVSTSGSQFRVRIVPPAWNTTTEDITMYTCMNVRHIFKPSPSSGPVRGIEAINPYLPRYTPSQFGIADWMSTPHRIDYRENILQLLLTSWRFQRQKSYTRQQTLPTSSARFEPSIFRPNDLQLYRHNLVQRGRGGYDIIAEMINSRSITRLIARDSSNSSTPEKVPPPADLFSVSK